jgi:hypothetical protein
MIRYAICAERRHIGDLTYTTPTGVFINAKDAQSAVIEAYKRQIDLGPDRSKDDKDFLRLVAIEAGKQKPKRTEHITDLMFRDTVTARMLRKLCEVGTMTQADFMKEYSVRCARGAKPCRACDGTKIEHGVLGPDRKWMKIPFTPTIPCRTCSGSGLKPESKSSFVDNFGRFVYRISWGARDRKSSYGMGNKPYAVIAQNAPPTKDGKHPPRHSTRNVLTWMAPVPIGDAPPIERLLWAMSNTKLHAAFTDLERQMLAPRATDNEDETHRWIERLRAEMRRRSS